MQTLGKTGNSESYNPLSREDLQQIAAARQRFRKLKSAAKTATFNGWCAGSFAALAGLWGFTSFSSLVLGIGLGVVAWNEFRGRALLRRLDVKGPRLLGWNQLAFMAMLILWSIWSIAQTILSPSPYAAQLSQSGSRFALIDSIDDLRRTVTFAAYGGVILSAMLIQGITAIYYFSRRKSLRNYVQQTPDWILNLQQTGDL